MTLTGRLTTFFLAALGLTLLVFSLSVYVLVRADLYAQVDARLLSALDIISAVVEVHADDVEWEVTDRRLVIGGGAVAWSVNSPDGIRVDGSVQQKHDSRDPASWRVLRKRIEPSQELAATPEDHGDKAHLYPYLDFIVAESLKPIYSALTRLALILIGVSVGVWVMALFGGRWVCHRALRPVTRMAEQAALMSAMDLRERLAVPSTGDELSTLGQSFNGLLARLEESFERQRRFTGDASHQLRTPLAAILGQVEVSLRQPRSAHDYHETLETVHGRVRHLIQIVEALLFLARSDADALPTSVTPISLTSWIPEHISTWSKHPRAGDFRLDLPQNDSCEIAVHPVLLAQLLDNLLDNAFKYSPSDSVVTIQVARNHAGIVMTVEDSGPGIAISDRPHAFDPFFRSTSARRTGVPGIGLGLAIVRRIAEAFQGRVHVSDANGIGCRIEVLWPAITEPISQKTSRSAAYEVTQIG